MSQMPCGNTAALENYLLRTEAQARIDEQHAKEAFEICVDREMDDLEVLAGYVAKDWDTIIGTSPTAWLQAWKARDFDAIGRLLWEGARELCRDHYTYHSEGQREVEREIDRLRGW
jgi:hypothetical protein